MLAMLGRHTQRGLALAAVTIAAAITFASRPARPDCSNPGGSVGFDQCQASPQCTCSYQIVTCQGGGWYTQYSVGPPCQPPWDAGGGGANPPPFDASAQGTPQDGGSGGARPGSGDGGLGGLGPGPSLDCLLMQSWYDRYLKILQAFEDPSLATLGLARGWDEIEYLKQVWTQVHQRNPPASSDPWLMYTNWKDSQCNVVNGPQGCARLAQMGLPSAACTASLDHEAVHVAQCNAAKAAGKVPDRYDLPTWEQYEIDAYQKELADLKQWLDANCK